MLKFLPAPLKGIITAIFFGMNTAFWCLLMYPFIAIKMLIPRFREWCSDVMAAIATRWIRGNSLEMEMLHDIDFDVEGLEGLSEDNSYLVCVNHQSWADIPVLQHVFNGRIPFMRFFLKQQLLYVPLLGSAWWGLDFPFMKRYSKSYLQKHPEKRGQDLETTRKALERFKGSKIAMLNFLEGTRFTKEKHLKQKSPYRNLLKPKAGGMAFMIEAMGQQFHSILDVTIVYPKGPVSLWAMFCGRVHKVKVKVQQIQIPQHLLQARVADQAAFREQVQVWLHEIWQQKDAAITRLQTS